MREYCDRCGREVIEGKPNYKKRIVVGDFLVMYEYRHIECVTEKEKQNIDNNKKIL